MELCICLFKSSLGNWPEKGIEASIITFIISCLVVKTKNCLFSLRNMVGPVLVPRALVPLSWLRILLCMQSKRLSCWMVKESEFWQSFTAAMSFRRWKNRRRWKRPCLKNPKRHKVRLLKTLLNIPYTGDRPCRLVEWSVYCPWSMRNGK